MEAGNQLNQSIEYRTVNFRKSMRNGRENFEQSNHTKIRHNWSGHQRTDAKSATNFRIDAGIPSGIVAAHAGTGAYAFPGHALSGIYRHANWWSGTTGDGTTGHLLSGYKGKGGARGPGKVQSPVRDELEHGIDIAANLADLAAHRFEQRGEISKIGRWPRAPRLVWTSRQRNKGPRSSYGALLLLPGGGERHCGCLAASALLRTGRVIRARDQQIGKEPFFEHTP
jgi:hypothetical protein